MRQARWNKRRDTRHTAFFEEPPTNSSKIIVIRDEGSQPVKPMPNAESRRMLSEVTLSRQPENIQEAVFEWQEGTTF
jgi:hypothetical protein